MNDWLLREFFKALLEAALAHVAGEATPEWFAPRMAMCVNFRYFFNHMQSMDPSISWRHRGECVRELGIMFMRSGRHMDYPFNPGNQGERIRHFNAEEAADTVWKNPERMEWLRYQAENF